MGIFSFLKSKPVTKIIQRVRVEEKVILLIETEFLNKEGLKKLEVGDHIVRYTSWIKRKAGSRNGIRKVVKKDENSFTLDNGKVFDLSDVGKFNAPEIANDGFWTRGSESFEGFYAECFRKTIKVKQ